MFIVVVKRIEIIQMVSNSSVSSSKISDRDQKILDLGDENFVPYSWNDLVDIIAGKLEGL